MTWDDVKVDDGGWAGGVASGVSRQTFVVPADVDRVEVNVSMYVAQITVGSRFLVGFSRNGVTSFSQDLPLVDMIAIDIGTGASSGIARGTISSGVLPVTAGETLAVRLFSPNDSSVTLVAANTSFTIKGWRA